MVTLQAKEKATLWGGLFLSIESSFQILPSPGTILGRNRYFAQLLHRYGIPALCAKGIAASLGSMYAKSRKKNKKLYFEKKQ